MAGDDKKPTNIDAPQLGTIFMSVLQDINNAVINQKNHQKNIIELNNTVVDVELHFKNAFVKKSSLLQQIFVSRESTAENLEIKIASRIMVKYKECANEALTVYDKYKNLINKILFIFEAGKGPDDYGKVTICDDGPMGDMQIKYGIIQEPEYRNMKRIIEMYVGNNGKYAKELVDFINKIGIEGMHKNQVFISSLKSAGNDEIMKEVQNKFFEEFYVTPALIWADDNKFKMPLSLLIIINSFIQLNWMPPYIINEMKIRTPYYGGDEKEFIKDYMDKRQIHAIHSPSKTINKWHPITQILRNQISEQNWYLEKKFKVTLQE
jgi:chitosanase